MSVEAKKTPALSAMVTEFKREGETRDQCESRILSAAYARMKALSNYKPAKKTKAPKVKKTKAPKVKKTKAPKVSPAESAPV